MTEKNTIPSMRFPLALLVVIGFLSITLGLQALYMVQVQEADTDQTSPDYSPEDADVVVDVGDGYFQQEESDMPEDEVEAEVGDLIYFYNSGDISHTATIREYDFDEHLNPGDETFLRVNEEVEDAVLDCTLHAHHEGRITVNEG